LSCLGRPRHSEQHGARRRPLLLLLLFLLCVVVVRLLLVLLQTVVAVFGCGCGGGDYDIGGACFTVIVEITTGKGARAILAAFLLPL
jgi:hypothetical protein